MPGPATSRTYSRGRSRRPRVLAAALALGAALLTACTGGGSEAGGESPDDPFPSGLTVGDDAAIYGGRGPFSSARVAIAGTVADIVDARSFLLVPEPGADERILVAHDDLEVPEGRAVEIIGRIELIDADDVGGDEYVLHADELRGFSPTVDFADEASLRAEDIIATGKVTEVLAPGALVLEDGLNTEQPLLVVDAGHGRVARGDEIRVLGTAVEFELSDMPAGLPTEPFERWAGLHYLRAREISQQED